MRWAIPLALFAPAPIADHGLEVVAKDSISAPFAWLRSWFSDPPKPSPERRIAIRPKVSVRAEIQAAGGFIWTNCIDFHRDGAKVVSKQGWATGTALFIRFASYRLMGFGYVRHCTLQADSTYVIGLEFRAPLMRQESGEWQIERVCQNKGVSAINKDFATARGASTRIH